MIFDVAERSWLGNKDFGREVARISMNNDLEIDQNLESV
jgi:hypothetical protein